VPNFVVANFIFAHIVIVVLVGGNGGHFAVLNHNFNRMIVVYMYV